VGDGKHYQNQVEALTAAIESGQGMDPDAVLLHIALALALTAQQQRGIKDQLRDFYHLAEEAFPGGEEGHE
jgi:hypothetical protein